MKKEEGPIDKILADPNLTQEKFSVIEKIIDGVYNLGLKEKKEDKKIPCYACQGGGCPVCNGYGYYYN